MATALSVSDPTSYSEPENYLLKHLHWDFTIDFNVQVLQGEADLEFEVKKYSNELVSPTSTSMPSLIFQSKVMIMIVLIYLFLLFHNMITE